jgi:hypothetical protein
MERGANGGFDFEKQGQTCKVKKRGANEQLDLKTRAVLQLALFFIVYGWSIGLWVTFVIYCSMASATMF